MCFNNLCTIQADIYKAFPIISSISLTIEAKPTKGDIGS